MAAREAQILELRLRRVTFEQIGKMFGISKQAAHKAYTRALNRLPNKLARMVRREELEVLDRLEAEFWRIISSTAAKEDHDLVLRAGGRILDTQVRRAKLLGLESPEQIALTLEADNWKKKAAEEQEQMKKLIRTMTPDERMLYLDLLERAYERLGAQPGEKLELSDETQKTMSSS
jgi:DNA-directed RNA polymerase specialized sigma24 family protein